LPGLSEPSWLVIPPIQEESIFRFHHSPKLLRVKNYPICVDNHYNGSPIYGTMIIHREQRGGIMSITPLAGSTASEIQIPGPGQTFLENIQETEDPAVVTDSSAEENSQATQTSFSDILSDFLPQDTGQEINEEQLFSTIIAERLEGMKGSDAVESYQDSFEKHMSEMTYSNGYVPVEDAARAALGDLVDQGVLTMDEAESIHAQSFQAAQLDDNPNALYDSLGSTIAVSMVEMALESSGEMLAAFDSGEKDAGKMSLSYQQDSGIAPATSAAGESGQVTNTTIGGGFLYKPVSESDGNLVVLLPSSMSGSVSEVSILDSNGEILDQGRGLGDYDDGRPLFRFSSPGSDYPENITVAALMTNGEEYTYSIPYPGQRYE